MKAKIKPAVNRGGDLVLQEIWRIKDGQSAVRGHDVHRLFAEARQRQIDSPSLRPEKKAAR
jgi:hypothetical protein